MFCRCTFCRFEISHFTPLAERTVSQQSYVFFLSARIPKILSKTVRSAGSLRSTLFSGNKSPSSRYFGVVVFRFPQLFFFFLKRQKKLPRKLHESRQSRQYRLLSLFQRNFKTNRRAEFRNFQKICNFINRTIETNYSKIYIRFRANYRDRKMKIFAIVQSQYFFFFTTIWNFSTNCYNVTSTLEIVMLIYAQ